MTNIPLCTSCPHLQTTERRDFHPAAPEHRCGKANEWIGFVAVRPGWCPLLELNKTQMELLP